MMDSTVLTTADLFGFIKFVGVFFMAAMAIIGFMLTILGYFLFKKNNAEIALAKRELAEEGKSLVSDTRTWCNNKEIVIENLISGYKTNIKKTVSNELNLSLIELALESDNKTDHDLYVILGRLMPTVSRKDLSTLDRASKIAMDDETRELYERVIQTARDRL